MLSGMLLYDSRVSGNCYKVRLLLAHLGHTYDRVEVDVVDRSDREQVLGKLNPALLRGAPNIAVTARTGSGVL